MISDEEFCGSGELKRQMGEAVEKGTIAHAILLCAERGTGRNYFARLFARDYLRDNADLVLRRRHPDCLELRGEGASGEISVDALRATVFEMSKSAVTSDGRRIVIIEDSANLNRSSATALLKTLEQPNDGVVFFMTADAPDDVFETIRSRCVVHFIMPPSIDECARFISAKRSGTETELVEKFSALFRGRIGPVLRALDEQDFRDSVSRGERLITGYMNDDRLEMLSALDSAGDRKDVSDTLFAAVFFLAEKSGGQYRTKAVKVIEKMKANVKSTPLKLFSTMLAGQLAETRRAI